MSKDSLIKGTLILTLAAFVARALGVIQRVPLVALIGDSGMATFSIAFNIYTPLMTIATAGIPSALSKMVSEKTELGRHAEADRIFRAAAEFALVAGLVMTIFLLLFAPGYARFAGDESASMAIRALAPALLMFPLIAIVRGYFQGRRNMLPNGLSQVVEQIVRVVTAVGLAYLLLAAGWGQTWAVAGASFGGVMGGVGAAAVLGWYWVKLRRNDRRLRTESPSAGTVSAGGYYAGARSGGTADGAKLPTRRAIYRQLFRLSVPIVLFSLAVPLIYFIDSSTVINLLKEQTGKEQAQELLGILAGRAQSLAGIPIILAIALSQSIVPIVSSAYARGDLGQVSREASRALQISVLTGLPLVLMIAVAARPINGLLFPTEFDYLQGTDGSGIIAFLTATALLQIVMQTSGAILMGMGIMKPLVFNVAVGVVVKAAAGFLLAPLLGIYGIVTATALCFLVMMLLNLRMLRKKIAFRILSVRRWAGLAVSAAVIVAAGLAVEGAARQFVAAGHPKLDFFVQACLVCGSVLILYPLLLAAARVVTKEDAAAFPAPVRKWFGKVLRAGRRGQ